MQSHCFFLYVIIEKFILIFFICYFRWPNAKEGYEYLKEQVERNKFKDNTEKIILRKEISISFIKMGIICTRQFRNILSQICFDCYYDNGSNLKYFKMLIKQFLRFYDYNTQFKSIIRFNMSSIEKRCKYIRFLFFIDETRNYYLNSR